MKTTLKKGMFFLITVILIMFIITFANYQEFHGEGWIRIVVLFLWCGIFILLLLIFIRNIFILCYWKWKLKKIDEADLVVAYIWEAMLFYRFSNAPKAVKLHIENVLHYLLDLYDYIVSELMLEDVIEDKQKELTLILKGLGAEYNENNSRIIDDVHVELANILKLKSSDRMQYFKEKYHQLYDLLSRIVVMLQNSKDNRDHGEIFLAICKIISASKK